MRAAIQNNLKHVRKKPPSLEPKETRLDEGGVGERKGTTQALLLQKGCQKSDRGSLRLSPGLNIGSVRYHRVPRALHSHRQA